MELVLQKFGGTSVQTKNSRLNCINKIKDSINNGNKLIIVISAIGRKSDPYSTDTLLSLVSEDFKKNNPEYIDKLISCGEIISAIIFSSELKSNDVEAIPLVGQDIGILTDSNFGNAQILNIDVSNIQELISENIVPVVAGFQGVTQNGKITTLGRGGSDISAVKLATALKCNRIEFFKDVNGLMTVDPKIVSTARSVENVSYEELLELTTYGNNIIHPEAVRSIMNENIPVVIKNTFNNFKGTMVNKDITSDKYLFKGMTYLLNCIQIKIFRNKNLSNNNYFKVFQKISSEDINIDFMNIFIDHKVFTIYKDDFEKIDKILRNYEINYEIISNCSKISIVKANLKKISIIIAKLIELLYKEDVEVLQTNHSNMSIWILVKDEDLNKSLNIIHDNFFNIS